LQYVIILIDRLKVDNVEQALEHNRIAEKDTANPIKIPSPPANPFSGGLGDFRLRTQAKQTILAVNQV
jgi:hypothetical protein